MDQQNTPQQNEMTNRADARGRAEKLEKARHAFYLVFTIIGIGLILWAIGMILGKVSDALTIVALSLVLSFFLHSPVNFFERKGIPRVWGTLLAFIIAAAVLVLLGIIIGPLFGDQITAFLQAVPMYVNQIIAAIDDLWNQYGYLLSNDMIADWVKSAAASLSSGVSSFASSTATGVLGFGISVGNAVIVVVMSVVAAFWILMDLPRMGREIRIMIGPKYIDDVMIVTNICSRVAGGYIKGVCIASCCTGIIAGIGFLILRMPYAVVLALIIAIMNVIPYIGPWVGGAIAAIIGLFVSPLTAILAIAITVFAQQFTDTFITPRIMSSTVDIHPVLVIVALIAGGAVGGIAGMILAVPFTAAIKAVYVYYFEKKTGRQLVSANGAFFRDRGPETGQPNPVADAMDSIDPDTGDDAANNKGLIAAIQNKLGHEEAVAVEDELVAQDGSERAGGDEDKPEGKTL